jgi:hypothetical protein
MTAETVPGFALREIADHIHEAERDTALQAEALRGHALVAAAKGARLAADAYTTAAAQLDTTARALRRVHAVAAGFATGNPDPTVPTPRSERP